MAATTLLSRAQDGMTAPLVRVEVDVGSGLPTFNLAGLAETVVRESKHRVRSAIENNGFEFPAGRVTVNLSPADLPKEGGRFDLPIALGLLHASKQLPDLHLEDCELYGELSLTGELRPVRGVLPAVCQAARVGNRLIVPRSNLAEAALVRSARVAGATHLGEVCAHVSGNQTLEFVRGSRSPSEAPCYPDLSDVRGQAGAARVLVRSAISERLPKIRADRASLGQAVLNLLASAIDQTPPGASVILSAQVEDDGRIEIKVRDSADRSVDLGERFVVFRDGVGKDGEALAPVRSSVGLALTRSLLAVNTCSLSVDPSGGVGTLFSLVIPADLVAGY